MLAHVSTKPDPTVSSLYAASVPTLTLTFAPNPSVFRVASLSV